MSAPLMSKVPPTISWQLLVKEMPPLMAVFPLLEMVPLLVALALMFNPFPILIVPVLSKKAPELMLKLFPQVMVP